MAGLAFDGPAGSPDCKYRAAGFANAGKSRVNLVYVSRMKDSSLDEVLEHVAGLAPKTTYTASAWVIGDGLNYTPVGAPERWSSTEAASSCRTATLGCVRGFCECTRLRLVVA